MRHQDGLFQGVRNTNIYYQSWLPEGELTAILLIAHGLAEHSGRYMNVVNHFVPLSYAVYAFDHVGHGKSDGERVYVERFKDFIDTLNIYVGLVRDWQPETPIFLVGHSMGGLMSTNYLLDYQTGLTGAVLSGPAMKAAAAVSPMSLFAGKLLSALFPRSGLLRLEAEGISRDPTVVQAYINDPLVTYPGMITARLAAELFNGMQRAAAEASAIRLPLLILQGGADRLVDPAGAQLLYDTVSSADKTLKIYDGLYHELFNEPEHKQVLHDVESWLTRQLSHNQ